MEEYERLNFWQINQSRTRITCAAPQVCMHAPGTDTQTHLTSCQAVLIAHAHSVPLVNSLRYAHFCHKGVGPSCWGVLSSASAKVSGELEGTSTYDSRVTVKRINQAFLLAMSVFCV